MAELSTQAKLLAKELKQKDDLVKKELAVLGVKDEAELVIYIEEMFPNKFVDRGKQIAIAQPGG